MHSASVARLSLTVLHGPPRAVPGSARMSRAACRASSARAVSSEGTFSSSLSYSISKDVFNGNAVVEQEKLTVPFSFSGLRFSSVEFSGSCRVSSEQVSPFHFALLAWVSLVLWVAPNRGFIKFSELLVGTAFKPASRTVKS